MRPTPIAAICTTAFLLLSTSAAHAECVSDGIVLYPRPGAVVPTNSDFILEARGKEVPRVTDLIGQTLYLRSNTGETVPVTVRKGWKSQMNRIAVRLVPKRLEPDTRYTLMLEQALAGYRNLDPHAAPTPYWTTGSGPDRDRPTWDRHPAPAEGRFVIHDGRLSREVRFNLALRELSPSYVVVTIQRARGPAKTQTYFAPVDGNRITLGHDGCSGGFIFEDGRAYFARMDAYDVAGNRAPPLKRIEFHAPKQLGK